MRTVLMGISAGVAAFGAIEDGAVVGPLLTIFGVQGFLGFAAAPRIGGVLAKLSMPAATAGFVLLASGFAILAWNARPSTLWVDAVETPARVIRVFGMDYFVYRYEVDGVTCEGRAPLSGWRTILGNSPDTERVGDTVRVYRTRTMPCLSATKNKYDPLEMEHYAILVAEFTPILGLSLGWTFGKIGRKIERKVALVM